MGNTVYRQYDQAALDAQYEQRTLVPDVASYMRGWRDASDEVRRRYDAISEVAYGSGERERIDLFPADRNGAPLVVFLHGGAWRRLSKDDALYPAPLYLERGIAFAAVGFDLVPAVTLARQVEQVGEALKWIRNNARRFGLDAEHFFLIGNSSGGHLAGMLMTEENRGVPRGALLVSGIYDLEPVQLSSRNEYLNLDPATAQALSPVERIPSNGAPLVVGWGGLELDEFQRQSSSFAAAWEQRGGVVERVFMPEKNHFDMTTALGEAGSPLLEPFFQLIEA